MSMGRWATRRGVLGANDDGAHWLAMGGAPSPAARSPARSRRRLGDMAFASRKTRQKLAECGALDAYVRLLRGDAGRSAAADAARAVSAWADDEPWLVEAKRMEPTRLDPRKMMDPTRADATTLEALAHTLARSPRARDALFAAGAFTRVAAALRESNQGEPVEQARRRRADTPGRHTAGGAASASIAPGVQLPADVARRVARGGASFVCRARAARLSGGREGTEGANAGEAAGGDARCAARAPRRGRGTRAEAWWGRRNTRRRRRRASAAARALRAME